MYNKNMKKLKLKNKGGLEGSLVFKVHDSITGEFLYETEPIKNLIVSSDGYGRNLIIRQLAGDTTYPIEIDSASIGTGSTDPTDSTTDLSNPVLEDIQVSSSIVSNDIVVFSFFIANAELPNTTYNEFCLKCNGRMFSMLILSPAFTKTANQNTTAEYTISLSSV